MKGRKLTQQECLRLNQGSKVYVEANNVFSSIENGVYIKLKGTCFTNIKKEINVSRFSVTSSNYINGYINVYEYEEEKEMKEYQTWEAIKMLSENPKLEFKTENGKLKLKLRANSLNFLEMSNIGCSDELNGNLYLNEKWTLVQKPVKFLEAVQAKKEGKTVYCILNKDKLIYKVNNFDNQYQIAVTADEILLGEWYVE